MHLAADVHVGYALVLAKQRQVEEDSQGARVGGEDDKLSNTTVQRLGGFVRCVTLVCCFQTAI